MSESSPESDDRAITDDQLPDDLNPEENPLAGDPEDLESGDDDGPDAAAATGGDQGPPG
jgi:hypothetical protein